MCLPVSCIKYTLSFFAAITLLIGIGGIVAGSIELAHISGTVSFDEGWNPAEVAPALMLGVGIIALFVGIIGLVGSSRKNRCCLCIYQFSVLPMVLITLALAIIATYATYMVSSMQNVEDQLALCKWNEPTSDCAQCGDNSMLKWVKTINTALYEIDTQVYGHQEKCQILADDGEQQKFYEDLGFTYVTQDSSVGVTSALDCQLSKQQKNGGNFIAFFEQEFKCSGMCSATPFYAFYKSTDLPAEDVQSCYVKIANWLDSPAVTGIAWGIFAYFLLNLILACCLCCHPERKREKQGENMYTRMNYYD